MQFERQEIADVVLIRPKRFGDDRGYFSEMFRKDLFDSFVGPTDFVQDNHSLSAHVGTIRGLHFQLSPRAQGKLLRVVAGAIWDVAVDLRPGSATFGKHVRAKLSADNGVMIWIPAGFAHGFVTLSPDTEVVYKVTDYYSPAYDRGIAFDDPSLGIDWGISAESAILSEKDRRHPRLSEIAGSLVW